jgi:hypothetical protein
MRREEIRRAEKVVKLFSGIFLAVVDLWGDVIESSFVLIIASYRSCTALQSVWPLTSIFFDRSHLISRLVSSRLVSSLSMANIHGLSSKRAEKKVRAR